MKLPMVERRRPRSNYPMSLLDRSQSDFDLLRREMDRLFDDFRYEGMIPALKTATQIPSYGMEESETHYFISLDLPGVKKEDVKIEIRNSDLMIHGKRDDEFKEKNDIGSVKEKFQQNFSQIFHLPTDIKSEKIEAGYKDGVLRITIPKAEATLSQTIKISEGKPSVWDKLFGHRIEKVA